MYILDFLFVALHMLTWYLWALQGIPQLQRKHTVQPASTQQVTHSPMDIFQSGAALDIFQSLIKNLDEEGRYFFLNAVANQLRFPNSHTHYFSYLLLYLFETNEVSYILLLYL